MTWPLVARGASAGRIDSGDGQFSIWNVAWVARTLVVDPRGLYDANIFYPHRGTLAYSEANLGAGAAGGAVLLGERRQPVRRAQRRGVPRVRARAHGHLQPRPAPDRPSRRRRRRGRRVRVLPVRVLAHPAHPAADDGGHPVLAAGAAPLRRSADRRPRVRAGPGARGPGAVVRLLRDLRRPARRIRRRLLRRVAGPLARAGVSGPAPPSPPRSRSPSSCPSSGRTSSCSREKASRGRSTTRAAGRRDGAPTCASGAWAHRWVLPYLDPWGEVLYPGHRGHGDSGCSAWPDWRACGGSARIRRRGITCGSTRASASSRSGRRSARTPASTRWLYQVVPVFSWLRAPSRLGLVVVLALAVLGGFARAGARGARGAARRCVGARSSLLAMADVCVAPLFMVEARPVAPAYESLRKWPYGPVAEFPFFYLRMDFPRHAEYMLYSTAHWKPLINGYSDHIPPDFRAMVVPLSSFPNPESFAILKQLRARYVVFHLNLYDRRAVVELKARIERVPRLPAADPHRGPGVAVSNRRLAAGALAACLALAVLHTWPLATGPGDAVAPRQRRHDAERVDRGVGGAPGAAGAPAPVRREHLPSRAPLAGVLRAHDRAGPDGRARPLARRVAAAGLQPARHRRPRAVGLGDVAVCWRAGPAATPPAPSPARSSPSTRTR